VVIGQGEVWWADLGEPVGSGPGFRRPVLVVHGDAPNRSALATVVCVPLTSQVKWAEVAGNGILSPRDTSLAKPSVANVSQIVGTSPSTGRFSKGASERFRGRDSRPFFPASMLSSDGLTNFGLQRPSTRFARHSRLKP